MKKNTMIIIGVVVALLVFGLLYSMMMRKKKSTKKEKFDDVQALEFQKVDMAMGGSGVLSDPIDQSRSEDLSPWRGELGM
jgi:vancomycin permeability regulator SanA